MDKPARPPAATRAVPGHTACPYSTVRQSNWLEQTGGDRQLFSLTRPLCKRNILHEKRAVVLSLVRIHASWATTPQPDSANPPSRLPPGPLWLSGHSRRASRTTLGRADARRVESVSGGKLLLSHCGAMRTAVLLCPTFFRRLRSSGRHRDSFRGRCAFPFNDVDSRLARTALPGDRGPLAESSDRRFLFPSGRLDSGTDFDRLDLSPS